MPTIYAPQRQFIKSVDNENLVLKAVQYFDVDVTVNGYSTLSTGLNLSATGIVKALSNGFTDVKSYTNEETKSFSIPLFTDYYDTSTAPSADLSVLATKNITPKAIGFDVILGGHTFNSFLFNPILNTIIFVYVDGSNKNIYSSAAFQCGNIISSIEKYVTYNHLSQNLANHPTHLFLENNILGDGEETLSSKVLFTYQGESGGEKFFIFESHKDALIKDDIGDTPSATNSFYLYIPYQVILYESGKIEIRYGVGNIWKYDSAVEPDDINSELEDLADNLSSVYVGPFGISSNDLSKNIYDSLMYTNEEIPGNMFSETAIADGENSTLKSFCKISSPKEETFDISNKYNAHVTNLYNSENDDIPGLVNGNTIGVIQFYANANTGSYTTTTTASVEYLVVNNDYNSAKIDQDLLSDNKFMPMGRDWMNSRKGRDSIVFGGRERSVKKKRIKS